MYNETLTITSLNDSPSCTLYIVLFTLFLLISVIISGAFIYFCWYKKLDLKNDISNVNYSKTEALIC